MSPFCTRFAARHLDKLPNDFRRDDGPARWFVQQVLWSLLLELVDSMLGGPPIPEEVRVCREGFPLRVSSEEWAEFLAELGCDKPETREHVGRLLAPQLLGEPPASSGRVVPVSDEMTALALLLCELDQRDRSGARFAFEFGGDLSRAARHHPSPAAFGPADRLPPWDVLIEYAGLRPSARDGPLRVAFVTLYRPLRRRLQGRRWSAPAAPPPVLSVGLLREALAGSRPAEVPAAIPAQAADAPEPPAGREALVGLDALARLLSPALLSRGDPLEAALEGPSELGRRLCSALADFLRGASVEYYGRPGDCVELSLPQAGWLLDERAAAPADPGSPRRYVVTSWGLRLYGRVVAPAKVLPEWEGVR